MNPDRETIKKLQLKVSTLKLENDELLEKLG